MHGRRDLIIIYERGTTDRGEEWRVAAVGWWIGSSAGSRPRPRHYTLYPWHSTDSPLEIWLQKVHFKVLSILSCLFLKFLWLDLVLRGLEPKLQSYSIWSWEKWERMGPKGARGCELMGWTCDERTATSLQCIWFAVRPEMSSTKKDLQQRYEVVWMEGSA